MNHWAILERTIMDTPSTKTIPPPKRHWCFSAWLILALIGILFAAWLTVSVIYPFLYVVMIAALYKWRRWGFYGWVVLTTVAFIFNLSDGVGFLRSAPALVSVAILYGVLQIGGDRKAWIYLK